MSDQIEENFKAFHAEHPEVYDMFVRFTRQLLRRGFRNGSAKLVFERIRWEVGIELARDPVKLNNNYTSRYARKFETDFPQFAGFFRTRQLREDSIDSTRMAEADL